MQFLRRISVFLKCVSDKNIINLLPESFAGKEVEVFFCEGSPACALPLHAENFTHFLPGDFFRHHVGFPAPLGEAVVPDDGGQCLGFLKSESSGKDDVGTNYTSRL